MRVKTFIACKIFVIYVLFLGYFVHLHVQSNKTEDNECGFESPCVRFCCNENENHFGCSDKQIREKFDVVKQEIGDASTNWTIMRGEPTCLRKKLFKTATAQNRSWNVYSVS